MQNNNQSQIASALLLAAVIIGGAILLKDSTPPVKVTENKPTGTASSLVNPITSSDHIRGNPNAKIIIVEYSDLECPFCKVFHFTMKQVLADNSDVAWVYRHYPIPALHTKAIREAEATECAWDQGGNDAFWKYTDELFTRTTSNDGLADSELPRIAAAVGLNVSTFNNCLASGKFTAKIQASIEEGGMMGITGTPTSLIVVNGKIVDTIPGNQPYNVVNERLKEARRY